MVKSFQGSHKTPDKPHGPVPLNQKLDEAEGRKIEALPSKIVTVKPGVGDRKKVTWVVCGNYDERRITFSGRGRDLGEGPSYRLPAVESHLWTDKIPEFLEHV